ncbi:MAG: heparinase II/III family protein [bacterium]|nr:heparinase II/III family protein [bacterium]
MKTVRNILQESTAKRWEMVRTNSFYQPRLAAMRAEAEELLGEAIPASSFAQYHLYYENGNRLTYENAYFERRRRLNLFAFLYFLDADEKYLRPLEDILWAILDEFTWALPAHVDEILPLKKQRAMLDLFASETGYTLSEIYFLLQDRLPELLNRRIEAEVQRRIIDSFLYTFPDGGNRWEHMDNNWAAVCAGSVGMAFLYMASEEEWEAAKPRLLKSIDNFLSGFHEDGACLEGFTYWQYGFGYFLQFAENLRQYTEGKENLLLLPKVDKIAQFQQNCILDDNLSLPVSDANIEHFKQDLYITHYLYHHFAGIELPEQSMSYQYGEDHCYRWGGFFRYFLWTDPSLPTCTRQKKSWYFEDAAWYLKNAEHYAFMAKAGDNDEPHNHNDIGSFCLSHNNAFLLYDLGAGEYTASYFQEETRYNHLVNASFGHSVPIIDGCGQLAGKQYCGSVKEHTDSTLSISREGAYAVSGLSSLTRNFTFLSNEILWTDVFCFKDGESHNITERLVTKKKPEVEAGCVKIQELCILFSPEELAASVQEQSYVGHQGEPQTVYFIDFCQKVAEEEYSFTWKLQLP